MSSTKCLRRRVLRHQRAGKHTVAQHRRAVGDLHDLVDVVGDEYDRGARRARCARTSANNCSTPDAGRNGVGSSSTRMPACSRPRRVRTASNARTIATSARSTCGRSADARVGVDVEAEAGKGFAGAAMLVGRQFTHHRVWLAMLPMRRFSSTVSDGHEPEMLVDEGQPEPLGRACRQRQRHTLAVDQQFRARLRRMKAREDLDQRRFAGAVLAEEAQHFARHDIERDVVERLRAAETLREMPQRECRGLTPARAAAASARLTSASTASRIRRRAGRRSRGRSRRASRRSSRSSCRRYRTEHRARRRSCRPHSLRM